MNSMKRQKDITPEVEVPRSISVKSVTGEEWRVITSNCSRKNEVAGPKEKWHSVADVSGGECKV